MKFKCNFLDRKLWKLVGEYSYEVCENNYFRDQQGMCDIKEGFRLGENELIIFTFSHSSLKVYYQKGLFTYQKTLEIPSNGEITFAFTENDRKEINQEKAKDHE